MANVVTRPMTAEEFFDWCQRPENEGRHWELCRGEVEEVSRPGERHGAVCVNVCWLLNGFVRQRRRGYVCSNDTGVVLEHDPDTVRGPDVILFDEVRRYEDLSPKLSESVPRLAVEVLSPTDRLGTVMRRVREMLNGGIVLVWVVEPEDRTVTVYRRDRLHYVAGPLDELTGEDVLPDLRVWVADLFYLPGEEQPPPASPPAPGPATS